MVTTSEWWRFIATRTSAFIYPDEPGGESRSQIICVCFTLEQGALLDSMQWNVIVRVSRILRGKATKLYLMAVIQASGAE